MKLGVENKKQVAILAVVGSIAVALLVYVYTSLAGGDTPAPAAAPVVATKPTAPAAKSAKPSSGVAANVGSTAAGLDPTLKMGRMLATEALVYTGNGRNIFSPASMPIAIPKPVASVRPKALPPPPPPQPVGPPPPPPIDLKFFGTATSGDGKRLAFLLRGDDVFLANDGDVVQRRYKVITVSANSVLVEDMTNNNRQTLPLLH